MAIIDVSDIENELGLDSGEHRGIVRRALRQATGAVRRYLRYDPEQKTHTEFYPQYEGDPNSHLALWEVEGQVAVQRRISRASTDELQLRHLPVRSITSLNVDLDGRSGTRDDSFGSDTLKSEGEDYWPNYDAVDSSSVSISRDGIIRSIGLWPLTPGTVKIVYTAGYTSDELTGDDSVIDASPIWETVLAEASRRVKKRVMEQKGVAGFQAGPLKSEKLGDYSYTVLDAGSRQYSGAFSLVPESREALSEFVNYGWSLEG